MFGSRTYCCKTTSYSHSGVPSHVFGDIEDFLRTMKSFNLCDDLDSDADAKADVQWSRPVEHWDTHPRLHFYFAGLPHLLKTIQ